MSETLESFTVKRRLWWRGHGLESSRLIRQSDGMMCCLGQWGLAIGVKPADMLGEASFSTCSTMVQRLHAVRPLVQKDGCDSHLANSIIGVNDDAQMEDAQRERRLVVLFEQLGYAVTFED